MNTDLPSLIVVGTGIRALGQMTTEALAWIKIADKVLYQAYDPMAGEIIRQLNPSAESLARFYGKGKLRRKSYQEMVEHALTFVRAGRRTCLVFYGHPGVLCRPGHEAIRQAKAEGYPARMLPALSAVDCLFADLGLDPGTCGCQWYEATDFLENGRAIDPTSLLILWQAAVLGNPYPRPNARHTKAMNRLIRRLCRDYRPDHEVIIYTASIALGGEATIERAPLRQLGGVPLSTSATLCLVPAQGRRPSSKRARASRRRRPSGVPRPAQAFQPGHAS
jgi:hypothetical protein